MMAAILLLGLVRLGWQAELRLARRNTADLQSQGAVKIARGPYPAIVLLHTAGLGALWGFGWDQPVNPIWFAAFAVLQIGRVGVLGTLGSRWKPQILIVPSEWLVARGPHRFVNNPRYVVVVGEIAVLPLCLGLPSLAVIFTSLNAVVLTVRIRAKNAGLQQLRLHAAG